MVKTDELISRINDKGLKMKFIATTLGISVTSLWRKIRGMTDFRGSEIAKLSEILGLSSADVNRLFLCKKV